MRTDINSNSYATISFSDTTGIPVDAYNTSEYYVLGPRNNDLRSDTFIGIKNYNENEKNNTLPSTGITLENIDLLLIIFNIIMLIVFFRTFYQIIFKIDWERNGEFYD